MQHLKNNSATDKNSAPEKGVKKMNLSEPSIFSIPRMYEDDYPRNDQWYIKLQKVEKKAKKLKIEMLQITERHSVLYRQTQQMILETIARRNKLLQAKSDRNNSLAY